MIIDHTRLRAFANRIVGAGGIGFLLFESIRTVNFDVTGAIVLVIFVVVYAIERLSGWIRSRLV